MNIYVSFRVGADGVRPFLSAHWYPPNGVPSTYFSSGGLIERKLRYSSRS